MSNVLTAIINIEAPNIEKVAKKAAESVNSIGTSIKKTASQAAANIPKITTPFVQLPPIINKVEKEINDLPPAINKVSGAISQLQKQVAAFGGGVRNFSFIASLKELPRVAGSAGSSLAAIKPGADGATQSLINLGRVVQDAPFGFLGIANNLNPLIEGFSRTAKSAGGFGGAMKAVGSQLLGAGGISLGVSLISTALILFGDKLFGSSKQANALNESLKNLSTQFADEASKLTTLVGVIENNNTSQEDRKKALQALNEQYDSYLKNLGIEEVTINNVTKAYDALIESLLKQAVVKGLQEQISLAVEETAKKIIKLQIEQEQQNQKAANASKKTLTEEQKKQKILTDGLGAFNAATKDGIIAQSAANQAQAAAGGQALTTEARVARLTRALNEQLAPLLNLTTSFSDLGIKLGDTGKKSDKFFDDTLKKAKELEEFFSKTVNPIFFDFDPSASKDDILKKAQEFIQNALGRDAIFPRVNIPVDLGLDLNIDRRVLTDEVEKKAPETFETVRKAFVKNFEALANSKLAQMNLRLDIKISQDFQKRLDEQLARINETITSGIGDLFSSLGEDIGNAISGKDITGGILSVLGTALQQIGKALIAYGLLKTKIDALLKSLKIPGPLAIGLGIAAIAAGQLLKNSVKNISGFRAGGGPVIGGQTYVVGERGPELFRAPFSGSIIPNNAIKSGGGGNMGAAQFIVTGTNIIRGKDLLQVFTLEQISQGRTT